MRRRTAIAQVLLLVIALLGVVYVGDSVTQSQLFSHSRRIMIELPSGGGLHDRSTVTFRGNRVGIVQDVRIAGPGIEAVVDLNSDVRIPVDTEAVVANLSPIGEQYLDFRPRSDGPPYLADGARIEQKDTRVPLRFDKLLIDAGSVARTINPDDIRTITDELATATDGLDLTAIGQQSRRTLTLLQALQPQTLSLMRDAHVTLTTVNDSAPALESFSTQIDALTSQLKTSDPTLRELITSGSTAVPQVDALLKDISPKIHTTLDFSLPLAELTSSRNAGLKHWLTWVPFQLTSMIDSTRDGSGRVVLVPNPSPSCDYGVHQSSPLTAERQPNSDSHHCTTDDPIVQQRGSQYVPHPAP